MRRMAAILLAVTALWPAACSGDDSSPATTPPGSATTSSPAAAGATPTELGERIGEMYLSAYDEMLALLAGRPEAATAGPALAALKERYVQELVALGWQREALGSADRAVVDARVSAALTGLSPETYGAYLDAYTYYGEWPEVAQLIADFNIIGQYANFDLLRTQAPEEAERLGIG